jgi:phage antirepressor YoqD-like protein
MWHSVSCCEVYYQKSLEENLFKTVAEDNLKNCGHNNKHTVTKILGGNLIHLLMHHHHSYYQLVKLLQVVHFID